MTWRPRLPPAPGSAAPKNLHPVIAALRPRAGAIDLERRIVLLRGNAERQPLDVKLCADWSLECSNRPGRVQDKKTSGTDQQAVHSGAGLSFELEEIVVRWPMAYGAKSAIERKQNDYAKICRTRRPQTVH